MRALPLSAAYISQRALFSISGDFPRSWEMTMYTSAGALAGQSQVALAVSARNPSPADRGGLPSSLAWQAEANLLGRKAKMG